MNAFANAISTAQTTRTENGMKTMASSGKNCVDFFFEVGASRGKDVTKSFVAAYAEDRDVALRVLQWSRDVRGGAGERQIFKDMLAYLAKNAFTSEQKEEVRALMVKAVEIGRWDDIFVLFGTEFETDVLTLIHMGLIDEKDGLCAKWMPRKGPVAEKIKKSFDWSPKFYRKTLVTLTQVVETQMCAKDWDGINFSHVPSKAMSRYRKAFSKNSTTFKPYLEAVLNKTDPKVKINASAVFPYEVLGKVVSMSGEYYGSQMDAQEKMAIKAQWEALPDYIGEKNILPVVDVSGSMTGQPMDVAVSLGLYFADKNKGAFKDVFCTFSEKPQLQVLKGDILQKMAQMMKSDWGMSTNLHSVFNLVLSLAQKASVPQEQMPQTIVIFSDMQFNYCIKHDNTAMEMIERKYEAAGYKAPSVIFWNINDSAGKPVTFDKSGAALVSGYSPAIAKSIVCGEDVTPLSMMLKTVMVDRYTL